MQIGYWVKNGWLVAEFYSHQSVAGCLHPEASTTSPPGGQHWLAQSVSAGWVFVSFLLSIPTPTRLTIRVDSIFLLYFYFEKTNIVGTGKGSLWAMLLVWAKCLEVQGWLCIPQILRKFHLLWLVVGSALAAYTFGSLCVQSLCIYYKHPLKCHAGLQSAKVCFDKTNSSDLPPPVRPPKPPLIAPTTWDQVFKNMSLRENIFCSCHCRMHILVNGKYIEAWG